MSRLQKDFRTNVILAESALFFSLKSKHCTRREALFDRSHTLSEHWRSVLNDSKLSLLNLIYAIHVLNVLNVLNAFSACWFKSNDSSGINSVDRRLRWSPRICHHYDIANTFWFVLVAWISLPFPQNKRENHTVTVRTANSLVKRSESDLLSRQKFGLQSELDRNKNSKFAKLARSQNDPLKQFCSRSKLCDHFRFSSQKNRLVCQPLVPSFSGHSAIVTFTNNHC